MLEVNQKRCRIFQDQYKKIKILGKGNFGEVFLAEEINTRKKVAIKVVDTRKFKNEDQKRHAENEKEICKLFSRKDFRHQHIVNVRDVSVENHCNYFVLEYIDGGELYERIKREGKIRESQAKIWFRQLIEAVAYIHKNGIVHRDLKPENVLLDKAGTIRLCDFGFGKIFNATQLLDTYCGSPFYAAPEMVTATPYRGPPVDMWSCGVILYAMLTGQLPFHCDTMPELFKKISMAEYNEPSTISNEALDLIRSLLCRNPKRRMTAEGVLKHAWLETGMLRKKKKMAIVTLKHHHYTTNMLRSTSLTKKTNRKANSLNLSRNTLPSPVISVGDEELAAYQQQQQQSKATKFLLYINRKSQVAPSRKEKQDIRSKKNTTMLDTAHKIKQLFSSTFIQKRLTTI